MCWYRCLQKVQRWANQISSTYLNWWLRYNYLRFWKTNVCRIGNLLSVLISIICPKYILFCIRLPNFVQIEAPTAEKWCHIHFSRWLPRRLNTTSGFVSVDVTAFRRSKSISKPNFVDISQMEAEIFFMVTQNGLGRGQFFFKIKNILGCSVTFYEYKNVFLMLVDNVCTIQALFVTKPLHYLL